MNLPADLIWPQAESLLACVEATLAKYDAPTCRSFIAPGTPPPWDVCCDCGTGDGMAWVQIASVNPTDDFPTAATGAMRCTPGEQSVSYNIVVLRCAATVDDQGRPPSSERLIADARKVQRDRAIISEAIRCCFLEDADPGTYVIGSWTPLGPNGGCVGGSTTLSLAAPFCRCPEH